MKKLLTSGIESSPYKTQKQDMYDDTAEILKPSIEVQKKVKKTIDNKQDELITQLAINDEIANIKQNEIIKKQDKAIKQLKDNQEDLTQSLNTLSEVMSQKGSQEGSLSRVEKWVGSLPSNNDPLDTIREEDEEDEEEKAKPKLLKTLFDNSDTEIIKKYGFDPTLNTIPKNEEIQKNIIFLDRQNENQKSNY